MDNTLIQFVSQAATAVGAVVIGAAGLFVAAELLTRLFVTIKERFFVEVISRKAYLHANYHPYIDWAESWDKAMFQYHPIGFRHFNLNNPLPDQVETNDLGYRTDKLEPPESDTFTVVILGGSHVWGVGARNNSETVAAHLESLLNDGFPLPLGRKQCRVFNLAHCNGSQTQDVLSLAFHGLRVAPDAVVSITGWNELVGNYPMRTDLLSAYRTFYLTELEGWEPLQVPNNAKNTLFKAAGVWARRHSKLASRFWRPARNPHHQYRYDVEELKGRISIASELFVEHLALLEGMGRAHGFEHLQFLQSNLYRKPQLTEDEARVIDLYDNLRPVHGGKPVGDFLRQTDIYADVMERVAADPRVTGPVTNLADLYKDDPRHIFYSLVHITDLGCRLEAEVIADDILKRFASSPES